MLKLKKAAAVAALGVAALAAGSASATLYNYSSTITFCAGTCNRFAALDVGSTINGQIEIDTAPNTSFTDADVGDFQFLVFNPAIPPSPPVGDPTTDNPLVLDSLLGIAQSNGSTGSTGSTNDLKVGELLIEFLIPPFSSNGAFVVFDLATGDGKVCLFYAASGCDITVVEFKGKFTQAPVPVPAGVWLFGSALLGFLGLKRRA